MKKEEAYLARYGQKDEQGRAQVVRNGYARERTTCAGVKFPDGQTRILADMISDSAVNLPLDADSLELAIHNI